MWHAANGVKIKGAEYDVVATFTQLVARHEREKYEDIITNMAKLLEMQQKREGVAVDMIEAAVLAEREACAKLCDDQADDGTEGLWDVCCFSLANKIRARGEA
jgi:TATA-binding protein-associated factor Taf7